MCQITYTLCDACATISITNKQTCLDPVSAPCKIEWIFDAAEPANCPECTEKAKTAEAREETEKAQKTENKKTEKARKAKLQRLQKLVDKMDEETVEAVRVMLEEKLKELGKEKEGL
ncbi:hypothetical protein MMC30_004377 [Trapelia coarctata]|nr:hypothetical protein [Trapelia coarctata]